jgi:hypothetical protein
MSFIEREHGVEHTPEAGRVRFGDYADRFQRRQALSQPARRDRGRRPV